MAHIPKTLNPKPAVTGLPQSDSDSFDYMASRGCMTGCLRIGVSRRRFRDQNLWS